MQDVHVWRTWVLVILNCLDTEVLKMMIGNTTDHCKYQSMVKPVLRDHPMAQKKDPSPTYLKFRQNCTSHLGDSLKWSLLMAMDHLEVVLRAGYTVFFFLLKNTYFYNTKNKMKIVISSSPYLLPERAYHSVCD